MRKTWCVVGTAVLLLVPASRIEAQDDAATRAVVEKAITAHGGKEKLEKRKGSSMKLKGKVHVMGQHFDYTGEFSIMMPDKLKFTIDTDVMGMKIGQVQVLNGDKGWLWNSIENKTTDLTKEMIDEGKEGLYAAWVQTLAPLTDKEFTLSPLGESRVGDRPAVGIRVSRKGHRDVNLFFDKEKNLLLKTEMQIKDFMAGGKEMLQETQFADYKDVDGMPVSHKLLIKRDGEDFVDGEASDVKLHEKLDDSIFVKP